jgi:hypothetical protein
MSPIKAKWIRKIKKYHKWPGIVVSLFTLLFAFSGILLNHRDLISTVDISRKWMPSNYQYNNWNLAAVRSSLPIGNDSLLLYGNIGVWMATGERSVFQDCNQGFPGGIDKRKIYSIVKFRDRLVAGTHFGVFTNSRVPAQWAEFRMPKGEERISDLTVKGDSLLILTRDYLYFTTDLVHLQKLTIPPKQGYKRQTTLFLTLWELHSGELFGFAGMLFVDLLALVLIFLSITGLLHFLFPKLISRLKRSNRSFSGTVTAKKWNLKWHNLIGYIFALFLLVNTTAGMFLRPPLLIPIASTMVRIVPYSDLDTENPWQDKLRRILWDKETGRFLVFTSEGFFFADRNLSRELVPTDTQPIVSIMGCNVLESVDQTRFLVGSFSGLFVWDTSSGTVVDYITGLPAESPRGMSRPVGQNMVAGIVHDCEGLTYWIDYNKGVIPANKTSVFPSMPEKILLNTPISLWNAALEIHTGRIFEHLVGPFYLLYVPLMGLTLLIVLISGFLVWWLAYRKK